jgi:hypothetical protein
MGNLPRIKPYKKVFYLLYVNTKGFFLQMVRPLKFFLLEPFIPKYKPTIVRKSSELPVAVS